VTVTLLSLSSWHFVLQYVHTPSYAEGVTTAQRLLTVISVRCWCSLLVCVPVSYLKMADVCNRNNQQFWMNTKCTKSVSLSLSDSKNTIWLIWNGRAGRCHIRTKIILLAECRFPLVWSPYEPNPKLTYNGTHNYCHTVTVVCGHTKCCRTLPHARLLCRRICLHTLVIFIVSKYLPVVSRFIASINTDILALKWSFKGHNT
jgi:hypothetical protein